ncbi:MAG: single-stranded-DNA-specific exonuclease RecJ [Gemmobacter sp.]
MTPDPAFLGVSQSLGGRRGLGPDAAAARLAEAIAARARLPLPVALVLAARGVAPEDAPAHLAPALRDLLPDPRSLRDMEVAAARLIAAVDGAEKIAIFADYDVDGGASAALLLHWLRGLGRGATLYVPDRLDEGYGPNVPAMEALARDHRLIVCVDCGTLSHEPLAAAAAGGADVVVLDHHLGGAELPPAWAVVNPNRADESGALGHLCAAGVVFLALVEANRQLRLAGRAGPDLLGLLDLVALATVADVAPLIGVNRAFVRQGLTVMGRRARPGLVALADGAGLGAAPGVHALGFVLGPRINAGGRVGRADLGARLLATDDPAEAARLAADLERLNAERREIEAEVRAAALAEAEARGPGPLAWAAGEGWHAGVVGIVAARLKEATGRPAVVIGLEGETAKGSARSVPGLDLGGAILRLAEEGLIIRGGGHRMAAGLTLARAQVGPAMARLAELVAAAGAPAEAETLRIEGSIEPAALTLELAQAIEAAGPFGAGAPAPVFALADQVVTSTRPVGTGHLGVVFGHGARRVEGIAFGAYDSPLGQALRAGAAGRWHVAGRIETSEWMGRTRLRLRIEDAAPAR